MEIKKNTEWKIIVSTNPKVGFLENKTDKALVRLTEMKETIYK